MKHNLRLPRETMLADGSYLTMVYPSDKDRRHRSGGIRVGVVEYRLEGVAGAEPLYRLVSSILDPAQAPAAELAALYHERWEIEGALAELKRSCAGHGSCFAARPRPWYTRSSGACCWRISPSGWGSCTKPPCRLTRTPTGSPSPTPCVSSAASCRCSRRFPPRARRALHRAVLEEILEERVVSSRGRQVPRGVKRKMSSYPLRPHAPQPTTRVDFNAAIRITK